MWGARKGGGIEGVKAEKCEVWSGRVRSLTNLDGPLAVHARRIEARVKRRCEISFVFI